MKESEIREGVQRSLHMYANATVNEVWLGQVLSEGAFELIVRVIRNIETDPSPTWARYDPDEMQRIAISVLPVAYRHLGYKYRIEERKVQISSWEVLHQMSGLLDLLCPIRKDL